MAQKSLFFNALLINGDYDRKYNADDISDWFSIVCTTGVLKEELQVTPGTGLSVNVAPGKATIKGKGYVNNAIFNLSVGSAPTGASPYYVPIKLQYNNMQTGSGRYIELTVGSPLTTVPTISDLTQNDEIYELMLAYAIIQPNGTSVTVTDTRGQDVCPWFTAVKGYDDYYDAIVQQYESVITLQTSSVNAVTDLPTTLYNDKYSLFEVYVNGLREEEENYTVNTSNGYISITFTTAKNADDTIKKIQMNAETRIQGASTHTLRHTCASILFKAGIPIEMICRILGNSREVCEKTYVHFTEKWMDNVTDMTNDYMTQALNKLNLNNSTNSLDDLRKDI